METVEAFGSLWARYNLFFTFVTDRTHLIVKNVDSREVYKVTCTPSLCLSFVHVVQEEARLTVQGRPLRLSLCQASFLVAWLLS